MTNITLEVCISSVEQAVEAETAGADRLELNVALELGGLTPTLGLFEAVRQATRLPILVMIRPRGGDFCYSTSEFEIMQRDARLLLDAGAAGLVFGILHRDGHIDGKRCAVLLQLAESREGVFHRAFDEIDDQPAALETLVELGFRRVLTSGGAPTAATGIERLVALQKQSAGRITVLPGGGINTSNVGEIVQRTGCREVHGTFKGIVRDVRRKLDQ